MEIFKEFTIEAAHHLPNVPLGHKCGRLHGHSFRIEMHVRGPIDPAMGWVIDFADIKSAFKKIEDAIDHRRVTMPDRRRRPVFPGHQGANESHVVGLPRPVHADQAQRRGPIHTPPGSSRMSQVCAAPLLTSRSTGPGM